MPQGRIIDATQPVPGLPIRHSPVLSRYDGLSVIHIVDARNAADVSHISSDPCAREHLLRSRSTLNLVKAYVVNIVDEDDPLFKAGDESAIRAELWMRQRTPDPE
jgi:hypothetical protein